MTYNDRRMNVGTVRSLLRRLGERAGVDNVHTHRFRHTCAIEYLRNSGDIFTLQSILGHKWLTMVKHYLSIATNDVAKAHRRASPVDGWRL
jgi:integrase/recombinase XerD